MARRALRGVVVACCALTLALTGCSQPTPPPLDLPTSATGPTQHADPNQSTQPTNGLTDMTAEQKHADLNSGFNVEWPVVAGQVTRVGIKRKVELDFAIQVSAPAADVASWYRTVMAERYFVLLAEKPDSGGTTTLTFNRAGVFYVVRVAPLSDTTSLATCAVATGLRPTIE